MYSFFEIIRLFQQTFFVPDPLIEKYRPSSDTKPAWARTSGNPDSPISPCIQLRPLYGYRNCT